MRPGPQLLPLRDSWDAAPASPSHAAGMLQMSARMLLQANQPPATGGFQAARYFTYVFFALAISVVLVMVFLCTAHCYRRARRARELEANLNRQRVSPPEIDVQTEPQRDQAPPPPKPLNVYDAVLVRHPDGSKEVAYAPELVARVLLPELSAVQKASLRRSGRINSISRYEDSDPRARRRRQALEGHLGRSRSGGIATHARQSSAGGLPPSSGHLLRGWSMDAGEVRAVSLHGYRQAREGGNPGHGDAAATEGQQPRPADRQRPEQRRRPERQRGDQGGLASGASSRAPRSRAAPARRHGSPAWRRRGHDEGDSGAQLTSEQLAASEAGRLQPFYSSRWHGSGGGGSGGLAHGGQHGPRRGSTNDGACSTQADAGLWLSSGSGSDSGSEGHEGDGRRRRLGPGGQSRVHRHQRRHRSAGGGSRR